MATTVYQRANEGAARDLLCRRCMLRLTGGARAATNPIRVLQLRDTDQTTNDGCRGGCGRLWIHA
jgi:hypothetical protein